MATIYRKYRPQVFDQVFGQEHVITTLKKALETERVAHAYIFTGSRGVGKTTVARLLAKAVNCLDKKTRPCGKCANCVAIAENKFIDLIEIDAASNRGIDEIRQLRDKVQFSPSVGKKRIYIIDEVHMLTREAFNALLKTLEEPPEHTVFIFATTEAHKVPATVLSRCQRFDFRLADGDLIKKSLKQIAKTEKLTLSDEVLDLIARVSEGSFRDAQSLLDQLSSHMEGKGVTLEDAVRILNLSSPQEVTRFIGYVDTKEASQAISLVENLKSTGTSIPDFLAMVILEVRSSLIEQIKKGQASEIQAQFLRKLMQAQSELKFSPVESLPIELMVYELCFAELNNKIQMTNVPPASAEAEQLRAGKSNSKAENPKQESNSEKSSPKDPKIAEGKIKNLSKDMKLAIVDEVSRKKKTLGSLLCDCSIEGDSKQVSIISEYPFHRDTLKSEKNLLLIEEVIGTIVGPRVKVNFTVKKESDLAGEIDSVFGGS
ncbi:MAG: DNA polymerase III subunit gamma/tau [bacterium]